MTKRQQEIKLPTYSSWKELPHVPVSIGVVGSIGTTGEWRILRPVISRDKCNRCGMCYLYCPEGILIFENGKNPVIDLTYCKGCGICAFECPKKAILMQPENVDRRDHGRDE